MKFFKLSLILLLSLMIIYLLYKIFTNQRFVKSNNKSTELYRYIKKKLKEKFQSLQNELDITSPVTWLSTWENSPEFKKHNIKPFYLEKNNLYISDSLFKFNPVLGPFTKSPDETSVYIYTKSDPNSSILSFRTKKQLITYGIKDNCNVPANTAIHNYSKLCNGMLDFIGTNVVDKYNTQFEQRVNNNGIPFLLHKATKLMVGYITVTQDLLNAVNMYPLDKVQAPFNRFYLVDIPDISFNVGTYMQVGDIIPLIYVGNKLANDVPKLIKIKLDTTKITNYDPMQDLWQYGRRTYNVVLNTYSKLTTNGNWIIQVPSKPDSLNDLQIKRLYYLPYGKLFILRTKPNVEDGTSDFEFGMPGLSSSCTSSQIYLNGKCNNCLPGQISDKTKTECLPNCPDGSYLYSNSCQKCNGIVTSDKLNCLINGKLLGKVYQNRPYEIQMEDGTFISVTDLLTFIAGPEEDPNSSECFRYGKCSLTEPWNCIVEGAEWIKDKALNFGEFLKNAVDKVGDWAKKVGSAALEWAKNAGKTILEGLIKLGNAISCGARKALREISSFFSNIFEQMKNAVTTTFNYIKNIQFTNLVDKIWGAIKTPLSMAISFYLDSVQCDYLDLRQNYPKKNKKALRLLEPYFVPNIRTGLVALVSELLIIATEGVIAPIIDVILPLVADYIYPRIDGLIIDLLEKEKIIVFIISLTDNIISKISFSCDWLKPPDDADELEGDISKLTVDNIENTSLESND